MNPVYKNQLLWCAHSLGFKTKKITNGLRNVEDQQQEVSEPFIADNDGEVIKRRSGTPFTNAYKQFRTQLFLPNLHRELLNAFFGWAPGGPGFSLSALPIPLSDPVASLGHLLPHLASSSRAQGVAYPEHAASRRASHRRPQIDHKGVEATWSSFSLLSFDESDFEDGGGEPPHQRQQSSASLTDDRRSFPEPDLRGEDNHRLSFHVAELQGADAWSQISIEYSDRQPFRLLEPRNRGVRDEPRSFLEPELVHEEDENRLSTAVDLYRAETLSTASTSRRSFPENEDPEPTRVDSNDERLSLVIINQPTSADSWAARRSFPLLELPDSSSGLPFVSSL